MSFGLKINDASGVTFLDSSKNTGLIVDFIRSGNITTTGYFTLTYTDSRYSGCYCIPLTVYSNASHTFNASVSGSTVTINGYVTFANGGNSLYAGAWVIKPTLVN